MATRRERKAKEAEANAQAEAEARARKLRIFGFAAAGAVFLSGGLVALWRALPDSPVPGDRGPASTSAFQDGPQGEEASQLGAGRQPAPGASGGPQAPEMPGEKKKTLEEVNQELKDKAYKQSKSPEWIWAESGQTEKVIEAFKTVKLTATAGREERAKLLDYLARNAKPRKEWSSSFGDTKLNELLDFLSKTLADDKYVGGVHLAASRALAAWGAAVPETLSRVEAALLAFYAADTRAGPRGEVISELCQLRNPNGLRLGVQGTKSSDPTLVRMSIYALANLIGVPPYDAPARAAIRAVAEREDRNRPLAAKLLALKGDRQIASVAPKLLKPGATPSDVEAGAFVVGRLKLKQHRGLVMERAASLDAMTRANVDQSLSELDKP